MPPRQCTDCHVNNNYNLTTIACVSCHLKDFQGTTNPNHVTSGFRADLRDLPYHGHVAACASSITRSTGFPLTGNRIRCRRGSARIATSTTITPSRIRPALSATRPTYNNATTPVATHRGLPDRPANSATTRTCGPMASSITPPRVSRLTGMHTVPPRLCTDCHVNNNYNITGHLRFVPPEGLPGHDQSESRDVEFAADLRRSVTTRRPG